MNKRVCVSAILLFVLAVAAQAAPTTIENFVAAVNKGEIPAEFPELNDKCDTPGLVRAFVSFVRNHPAKSKELLQVVANGFRVNDCPSMFGRFAAEVHKELFANSYGLLDDIPLRVNPEPPRPPITVNAPPTTLDIAERQHIAASTVAALRQPLLIASAMPAGVGALAVALLIAQMRAQKRARGDAFDRIDAAAKNLNGLFTSMKTVVDDQKLQNERAEALRGRVETAVDAWSARLPARLLSADDLARVSQSLDAIWSELSQGGSRSESKAAVAAAIDVVALERDALRESWQQFYDRKDLAAALDHASRDEVWQKIQNALLFELPKHVPDELKPSFDAAVAPARDYHNLVTKISLAPRVVKDELPRLDTPREIRRTRELAGLLDDLQNSTHAAERLNFHARTWITDTFLGFADLYLQRYQQAQLESRAESLRKGAAIVRDVLQAAAVEPIDVTLGQTTFDSTRHVGRSTANDPRFGDGVIVGVIRNGFMEGGRLVIRQPEVIVNRTR